MSEGLKFRPITDDELQAFQGCEFTAERPLLADVSELFPDSAAVIIIDDARAQFHAIIGDRLDDMVCWDLELPRSASRAVCEAMLAEGGYLEASKFERYGFEAVL